MLVQAASAELSTRTAATERPNDAPRTRPEVRSSTPRTETASASTQRPSQYRLVYDKEFSRVFVQIVDRDSGEEILRFPPEELIRFIDNLISEVPQSERSAGLFLDRTV